VREGILDYLVLSQDDTAEFGLNVQEKNELQKIIDEFKLKNVVVKTGADEIPSSLMTRSILAFSKITPSVYPLFFDENSKNIISRYEDITIENSVNGQITLSGAKVAENIEEADLVMVVNAPLKTQDDLCMKVFNDENNEEQTNKICDFIKNNSRPFFIADIKNANGGNDLLMDKLLTLDFDKSLLYGYSGWNTTGNTLGSTLSIALSRFISEKTDNFNEEMFKKALFVRLMDDWIYQSIVRQTIRDKGDMSILTDEMNKYVQKIADFVGFKPKDVKFSYPWDRTFEIEITVN